MSEGSVTPEQISTFFSIYKGINALNWASHTNYHLVPPHTDSVPPSTNHCCPILTQHTASSSRNAQLSQLDLVLLCPSITNSWESEHGVFQTDGNLQWTEKYSHNQVIKVSRFSQGGRSCTLFGYLWAKKSAFLGQKDLQKVRKSRQILTRDKTGLKFSSESKLFGGCHPCNFCHPDSQYI